MQFKNITSFTGPHYQISQEHSSPILLMLKNLQNHLQLEHIRKAKS